MEYNLKITTEQATLINKALDLFSRIHIHQIEEVGNLLNWSGCKDIEGNEIPHEQLHRFVDELRLLKPLLGDHPNGSHGIHSPHANDDARKAWDIQKVIRHKLAWDRKDKDPETEQRTSDMFGVDFDTPTKSSHDDDYNLPTIEKQ